jgi:hypothetical protein
MTASGITLQNSAILRRSSTGIERSARQSRISGWIPISTQFLDGMLGRLGLQLAGGRDVGQQRQVHVADVVAAFLDTHLADGFQEGQRLDVADRAADLDDRHVGAFGAGLDLAP